MKKIMKSLGLVLALSASNVKEVRAEDNVLPPLEIEYTSSHMHTNLMGTDYDLFERTEFDGKKSCLGVYRRTNPSVGLTLDIFVGFNGKCDGKIDALVQKSINSNSKYFVFCDDNDDSREKCDKMQNLLELLAVYENYAKKIWYKKRNSCTGKCKLTVDIR